MFKNFIDKVKTNAVLFFINHGRDIIDIGKVLLIGLAGGVVVGATYRAGFTAGENNMLRNMVRKNTILKF